MTNSFNIFECRSLLCAIALLWCCATCASKRTLNANTIRAACPKSVVVLGHFACGILGTRQQMLSIEPSRQSLSKGMEFNERCHVYRNLVLIISRCPMIFHHICPQLKSIPNLTDMSGFYSTMWERMHWLRRWHLRLSTLLSIAMSVGMIPSLHP